MHRSIAPLVCLGTLACLGSESGSPQEAKQSEAAVDRKLAAVDAVEKSTGGLEAIKKRGTIRFLVRRSEANFLPRAGMPWLSDIENAESFAESLEVEPIFVLVDSYDELIPALVEGRGDVVAAQLTVTKARKKKIQFARSTLGVEEIVVGKKGAKDLPQKPEDLEGREVVVRSSSSYAGSLAKLAKKGVELKIAEADEHLDTAAIVDLVVASEGQQLTVVDSHLLQAIESYNDQVVRLFPLAEKREISWGVRKNNNDLKAALDRFMIKRAMTERR
ncbi:MAG: transporter substrate-binding domain-containing protein, partial [Myxococcota bacterium]